MRDPLLLLLGVSLLGLAGCRSAAPPPPAPRPADLAVALVLSGGPAAETALSRLGASVGITPPPGWRDPTGQGLVTLLGFGQLSRHERSPSFALLAVPDPEALLTWMRSRGRVVSRADGRALVRRAAASPHAIYAQGARALSGDAAGEGEAAEAPDLALVSRGAVSVALFGQGVEDAEAAWGLSQAEEVEARARAVGGAVLRVSLAPAGLARRLGEGAGLAEALKDMLGPADPAQVPWLDAAAGLLAGCAGLDLQVEFAGDALDWTLAVEAAPGTTLAGRLEAGPLDPSALLGPEPSAALELRFPGWREGLTARAQGARRALLTGRLPEDRLRAWLVPGAP